MSDNLSYRTTLFSPLFKVYSDHGRPVNHSLFYGVNFVNFPLFYGLTKLTILPFFMESEKSEYSLFYGLRKLRMISLFMESQKSQ
ncbi:hypothetical protein ES703_111496 [subsurface metagenome]